MSLLRKGTIMRRGGINFALSFDGLNDYVDCGTKSDFDLIGTELSIEARIKAGNQAYSAYVLARNLTVCGAGFQYGLWLNTYPAYRTIWVCIQDESWGITMLPLNQWAHVVFTLSSPTWKLYVDGALMKTRTFARTITTRDYPLYIGARNDNGSPLRFLNGVLRNVRLYNRALELDEVLSNMRTDFPITEGLVLSYPMNEGKGTTIYDKSGKNNHGTIYGATWTQR